MWNPVKHRSSGLQGVAMPSSFPVISPIDGQLWWTQPASAEVEIQHRLNQACRVQATGFPSLDERLAIVDRFTQIFSQKEPYSKALPSNGPTTAQCLGELRAPSIVLEPWPKSPPKHWQTYAPATSLDSNDLFKSSRGSGFGLAP